MDYLLFRLYAPMASWGEIAVGESRHTAAYPGKSAIIGLMAAALGIDRSDVEKQRKMQHGYGLAVEVFSKGGLLRDYHTTQAPRSVGKLKYQTRRDELIHGEKRLGTILSSREYCSDALALVAVKTLPGAPYDLETVKTHLEEPIFHLYLGRKSCPLAAPMNPEISKDKMNYYEAFTAYAHKPLMPVDKTCEGSITGRDTYWLKLGNERHYYWDGDVSDFSNSLNLSRMQTRIRHDQPLSRTRWQFLPRQEHYFYHKAGE